MRHSPDVVPLPLVRGDTVLLTSVSSPVPSDWHLANMVACLESLGTTVRLAPHVMDRTAYTAGTAETRSQDLNAGLADPAVRAIFFAWGGKGANHLLPLIDYDAIARDPKWLVGLSDPVSILNAVYARTGCIGLHGPTGVNFSDPNGLHPYTHASLTEGLFGGVGGRSLPQHSTWESLRGGTAVGPLLGGHLSTVQTLVGTPYEPCWDDAVFFWEEVGRPPRQIDHTLSHFRLAGILDRISAMVVGRLVDCDDVNSSFAGDVRHTVLDVCDGYGFPIVFNVDSGHADPKLTLPIGGIVQVVAESSRVEITLEAARRTVR